ncbi:MAG: hypothetical protein FWB71_04115 [Defluviitaleaceae bacterium]|nr:hypothetical protein [Defluviitaleaceae bacterium]
MFNLAINQQLNNSDIFMGGRNRINNRESRREAIIRNRNAERQMEMRLRENEDERISRLKEKIANIKGSDHSTDSQRALISGITDSISLILQGRAEREAEAAAREKQRNQAIVDEITQMRDRPEREYEDCEEAEASRERSIFKGFISIDSSREAIHHFARIRANLTQEAGILERGMVSENSNMVKIGTSHEGEVLAMSSHNGFADPFKAPHLANLNRGIAGLTAGINGAIAGMYRESARLQNESIQSRKNGENDECENTPECDYIT